MASRAELVMMCKELEIDYDGLSIDKMKKEIKLEVDKRFSTRKVKHGADHLSDTLRKFMTLEYDYKIYNKDGTELDYNLKEV